MQPSTLRLIPPVSVSLADSSHLVLCSLKSSSSRNPTTLDSERLLYAVHAPVPFSPSPRACPGRFGGCIIPVGPVFVPTMHQE